MERDLERILITREQIAARVREMAREIATAYQNEPDADLTIVAILSGSLIFLADLIRELPLRMKLGLITVSSYRGSTTEAGKVEILKELNTDVAGRHVLLVDDILDTGGTLRAVRPMLLAAGARSVQTCVLLRKTAKAPTDVPAEFIGFDIEDVFVVGYGLDFDDHYRNLPEIGVLRPEFYNGSDE
jgi:hypoxanthine phosphoribosyltransferase